MKCIGRATIRPANAPTALDVVAEEDTKQAEGSHPAKEAYAKPARLPITVKIIVIFMFKNIIKYSKNKVTMLILLKKIIDTTMIK